MIPQYISIGHITQDLLPNGDFTPGGTVSFSAVTARNLGKRAGIVTVSPLFIRNLPIYEGIKIVGRISEKATIFENVYKPGGREQFVRSVAPNIKVEDVPTGWVGPESGIEIVHIGPVAQECGPELLSLFPKALIGITPQGFMRDWAGTTGRVHPILWEGPKAEEILSRATALVLSKEDLPRGLEGARLLEKYIECCPIVAYTRGSEGCTIFFKGQSQEIPAFSANEIDPTGAGDVFATAFFINLKASQNPFEAARFANATAACNIEKTGLEGVPTLQQVIQKLGD